MQKLGAVGAVHQGEIDPKQNQAYNEYKHSLTFRIQRYVVISNKTRTPIANPPNSAQLENTSYHSPKLHPGPCSGVGMHRGIDTHRWP